MQTHKRSVSGWGGGCKGLVLDLSSVSSLHYLVLQCYAEVLAYTDSICNIQDFMDASQGNGLGYRRFAHTLPRLHNHATTMPCNRTHAHLCVAVQLFTLCTAGLSQFSHSKHRLDLKKNYILA